jgi:cyclin-dependent kinase 12/13
VLFAQNEKTKENVAIKCVKYSSKEGVNFKSFFNFLKFPIYLLREINHLKLANHENIVSLKEIIPDWENHRIFLIFEYIEHDLTGLIMSSDIPRFTEGQIKNVMLQLLKSVAHLHSLNIVHRDIKRKKSFSQRSFLASNILMSHDSELKLADFGLSRLLKTQDGRLTHKVVVRSFYFLIF